MTTQTLLLLALAILAGFAAGWLLRGGQVAGLKERLRGQEQLKDRSRRFPPRR